MESAGSPKWLLEEGCQRGEDDDGPHDYEVSDVHSERKGTEGSDLQFSITGVLTSSRFGCFHTR